MPDTALSEHRSKKSRQGLLFLVMVKGKKQKRHWKLLKDKAQNKAPGHITRKLPFCSVVMEKGLRKGLEKKFVHSFNKLLLRIF